MDKNLLKIRKVKPEDARDWIILKNKVWRYAYSYVFPEEVFAEKDSQVEEEVKTLMTKCKTIIRV